MCFSVKVKDEKTKHKVQVKSIHNTNIKVLYSQQNNLVPAIHVFILFWLSLQHTHKHPNHLFHRPCPCPAAASQVNLHIHLLPDVLNSPPSLGHVLFSSKLVPGLSFVFMVFVLWSVQCFVSVFKLIFYLHHVISHACLLEPCLGVVCTL